MSKVFWVLLFFASSAFAGIPEDLDETLQSSHTARLFESASVLVGRGEETLYTKTLGAETRLDSRFDLASLTKPLATAIAIHALVDRGLLTLETSVSTILPEFSGRARETITVADLLAHQGGLPAGIDADGLTAANFERILTHVAVPNPPGTEFLYSDAGYLLLGLVVEKVSGMSLDEFTRTAIYARLGRTTSFNPDDSRPAMNCGGCAAKPHDPVARKLFPRSVGHAGLYGSAPDVAAIVRMILRGGLAENGQAVLSAASAERLRTAYGLGIRTLGFDLTSGYSRNPRGEIFPAGVSFGHTGYTGTSVWIDPLSGKFAILLTNRTYRSDSEASRKSMAALRKAFATLAGQL